MTATRPTDAGLLAAILADPADDGPRLVFADWLDEHGQEEYAEFIRLECDLSILCEKRRKGTATEADEDRQRKLFDRQSELIPTVYPRYVHPVFRWLNARGIDYGNCVFNRGGFVASVTLPTLAFVGGPCGSCADEDRATRTAIDDIEGKCRQCDGTGRVPGIAADLFRTQPVTRVTLSDREPFESRKGEKFRWWDGRSITPTRDLHPSSTLPAELYDGLTGFLPKESWDRLYTRDYPTRAAAIDALSSAAVAWGREQAGLEPLKK